MFFICILSFSRFTQNSKIRKTDFKNSKSSLWPFDSTLSMSGNTLGESLGDLEGFAFEDDASFALALQLSYDPNYLEDIALAMELQESECLSYQHKLSKKPVVDKHSKISIASRDELTMDIYYETEVSVSEEEVENAVELDLEYAPEVPTQSERLPYSKYVALQNKSSESPTKHQDENNKNIILKLISNTIIDGSYRLIGRGKEADIFITSTNQIPCIMKIYKKSLITSKYRSEFVKGDWRYRYCSTQLNKDKLFKIFPEKELRNMKRVEKTNIPSPKPILLKKNVLLMSFIGKDGVPAVVLGKYKGMFTPDLYQQCIKILRTLYQECRLVHTDANAFNFLIQDDVVHLIDYSQAIDSHHPNAFYFLRKDCDSITKFFMKKGVEVLSIVELFKFITDKRITEEQLNSYLDEALSRSVQARKDPNFETEEKIYVESFIPRNMSDIKDPFIEIKEIQDGTKKAYYFTLEEIESMIS